MLNYVAGYVLTYLIFQSESYWRADEGLQRDDVPDREAAAAVGRLAGGDAARAGRDRAAARRRPRRARGGRRLGALLAHAVRVRGAGARRLRARGALCGHPDPAEDPGGDGDLGCDRRARRVSQDGDFRHALDGDPNGLQKQAYGYTGIVVAALARYNPFAVVLVAFLIGGLENAGNTLQGVDFPSGLVGVIQGIILFSALGGELLVRHRVRLVRGSKKPPAAVVTEPVASTPAKSGIPHGVGSRRTMRNQTPRNRHPTPHATPISNTAGNSAPIISW